MRNQWRPETPVPENIKLLAKRLGQWNKECIDNIHRKKRRLWARLHGIQKVLVETGAKHLIKLERKLHAELDLVLEPEELLWFQDPKRIGSLLGTKTQSSIKRLQWFGNTGIGSSF